MRWRVFFLYQTVWEIALGNTWVTVGKEIAGYPQLKCNSIELLSLGRFYDIYQTKKYTRLVERNCEIRGGPSQFAASKRFYLKNAFG